jgi:hypothetical protein
MVFRKMRTKKHAHVCTAKNARKCDQGDPRLNSCLPLPDISARLRAGLLSVHCLKKFLKRSGGQDRLRGGRFGPDGRQRGRGHTGGRRRRIALHLFPLADTTDSWGKPQLSSRVKHAGLMRLKTFAAMLEFGDAPLMVGGKMIWVL